MHAGTQDVEKNARDVDPEVAEPVGAAAGEAADHRGDDRDARRGREEVLDRQPCHLGEVGHRRLAAVELPVRVGDERRRRVEGEVPGRRAEVERVERVERLGAKDQVERQEADEVEEQDRARVTPPVVLDIRLGADQAQRAALDRAEDRGRARLPRPPAPVPGNAPTSGTVAVRTATKAAISIHPATFTALRRERGRRGGRADEHGQGEPDRVSRAHTRVNAQTAARSRAQARPRARRRARRPRRWLHQ